jgi:hypothetical protein
MSIRNVLKNNGLTIAMFSIFLASFVAMSVAGWKAENSERTDHNQELYGYGQYVTSGNFVEAVFEN